MKPANSIIKKPIKAIWRTLLPHVRHLGLAMVARRKIVKKVTGFNINPYPFRIRELLDSILPSGITGQECSEIEVVIPSTAKDAPLLNLAISAVRQNTLNPIGKISIICPAKDVADIKAMNLHEVDVLNEEDVLGKQLIKACDEVAPDNSKGWVRQQAIKYASVLHSSYLGVLILDSDTILLKPQTWLFSRGRQSLAISYEYHPPYQVHFEKFLDSKHSPLFPRSEARLRVSFVTHHQLMQPSVLRKFLSDDVQSSPEVGLVNWVNQFDFVNSSPACEYHCYGTFITSFFPERVEYIQWANRAVSRKEITSRFGIETRQISLRELRSAYPYQNSVSLHAYL